MFSSAFSSVFMFVPFYYGHRLIDIGRLNSWFSSMLIVIFFFSALIVAGTSIFFHRLWRTAKARKEKPTKNKTALTLILLLMLSLISETYAAFNPWIVDEHLNHGEIILKSPYWVTNGYWDAKGFQWGDPDTTNSSGFSCNWQDDVASIWVGDWEHDYYQGITVGALRQGSVWDLKKAPWYDQTTYQPTALHFSAKSAVTLSARVRIDSQQRTGLGWMNWLFNPWFRVKSTFGGATRERLMVWDIVWGWNNFLGFNSIQDFVDQDQNLHLGFYLPEMAQTGEWKTYRIDLVQLAQQARNRLIPMPSGTLLPLKDVWQFEVDDLYLWSIEVLVEGFDYDTQFSVDYLKVEYKIPNTG